MKTPLTLDLEKTLYAYWEDQGAVPVEEVTMPDDQGIVDTLVMQPGDPITWRCFELKVTKSDFHSTCICFSQKNRKIIVIFIFCVVLKKLSPNNIEKKIFFEEE